MVKLDKTVERTGHVDVSIEIARRRMNGTGTRKAAERANAKRQNGTTALDAALPCPSFPDQSSPHTSSSALRSTQNRLHSGSAIITQPVPSGLR